jgi:hypothetical protein
MSLKKTQRYYHILIFGKKIGQTKVLSVRQELKVCLTECQANFSAVSRSLLLQPIFCQILYASLHLMNIIWGLTMTAKLHQLKWNKEGLTTVLRSTLEYVWIFIQQMANLSLLCFIVYRSGMWNIFEKLNIINRVSVAEWLR